MAQNADSGEEDALDSQFSRTYPLPCYLGQSLGFIHSRKLYKFPALKYCALTDLARIGKAVVFPDLDQVHLTF